MSSSKSITIKVKGVGASASSKDIRDAVSKPNASETNKKISKTETHPHAESNADISDIVSVSSVMHLAKEIEANSVYLLNRHFSLTDDYRSQRDMNIAVGVLNSAISDATAIGSAVMTGNPFIAGAALVGVIANRGISIAQNYIEENDRLRQSDYLTDFSRVRAGYSLTSGSIGDNK